MIDCIPILSSDAPVWYSDGWKLKQQLDSKFDLQSRYNSYLWKKYEPPYPPLPAMG